MQLTFTDPTTKEKLILSEFKAEIDSDFKASLGKDPDNRRYRCDDEDQMKPLPIRFTLSAKGTIDTAKEGRLRTTVLASYIMDKGKDPENKNGFRVSLRRETTDQELGGFVTQDRIGAMVRAKSEQFGNPAKAALLAEISIIRKAEEVASSAHAARARVAGMVLDSLKKS